MSSAKNWTAYAFGADSPAISPMVPRPEKETPVTCVLEVESVPEGVSVVPPILKVTVAGETV